MDRVVKIGLLFWVLFLSGCDELLGEQGSQENRQLAVVESTAFGKVFYIESFDPSDIQLIYTDEFGGEHLIRLSEDIVVGTLVPENEGVHTIYVVYEGASLEFGIAFEHEPRWHCMITVYHVSSKDGTVFCPIQSII